MSYISLVLMEVISPNFLLLTVGAVLQRKLRFPLRPIANLITYCFMPAAVFFKYLPG
ncbi:hypothetical protein RWE15_12180 [Virgibacillus halophilus]|uniref:Uncharacterized protein n=1 Tax=Tigheibacillus halophilus TaxID=361280 RepID=A0ABU5C865_9BACI|nr:hypothetical protein [Virgibacillus halophilus]